MSGNVLETRALDELLPDWQEGEAPPRTLAVRERFYLLTERWALRLPTPPQMKNKKKKNQIISLRSVPWRWCKDGAVSKAARLRDQPYWSACADMLVLQTRPRIISHAKTHPHLSCNSVAHASGTCPDLQCAGGAVK